MAAKARGGNPLGDRAALGRSRFASSIGQWRQARVSPISCWNGVEVNDEGRVEKLDLHGKEIKCLFPKELCELDALKELILHTNRLSGTLPSKVGQLTALEKLDLWDNFLEGCIPKALSKLTALTELHLSGNFFSGPIPPELSRLSNLRALYLHGNKLSGEIPRSLGDLRRLQKLVLINNRLTGPIPPELGKLKVIVEINLANNRLSGPIPAELGQLCNLTKLYLWGNNLSGSIPEELGDLPLLEKLDLAQNALLMSGGGIPKSLRTHRNFRRFVFAVPELGAPIPPWISKRSLLPALVLGYLDFLTDLATVLSYGRLGMARAFAVGLAFIIGPALVDGAYVLRENTAGRGAAAAAQLGLVVESFISIREESYSNVLVALRVLDPLFRSMPQVLLQAYMLLVDQEFLALRVVSLVVSTLSLAMASTGILAEHPLSQLRWARGIQYPSATLPIVSKIIFGTVPYVGSVYARMGIKLHPQDFVWWFLLYQILEIVSKVLSLAVVALPLGLYTFVILGWLWVSRAFISRVSIGGAVVRERLRFRKLIRFAAAPIMDSVIDRVTAYKVCCFFTCVETVCFLAVGNAVSGGEGEAALSSDLARPIFSVVSIITMGGKIALATALVVPFKEKIGEVVPPETGELRMQQHGGSSHSSTTTTTSHGDNKAPSGGGGSEAAPTTRGVPGGLGHGSAGPVLAAPGESGGLSVEAMMMAVGPDSSIGSSANTVKTRVPDEDDEGYDEMESARRGGEAVGKVGATGAGGTVDRKNRGRDEELGPSGGGGSGVSSGNIGGSSSSGRLQSVEEEREEREQEEEKGEAHRGGLGSGDSAAGSGGSSLGCKEDEDGSWEDREEGIDGEGYRSMSSFEDDENQRDAAPSYEGGGRGTRTRTKKQAPPSSDDA